MRLHRLSFAEFAQNPYQAFSGYGAISAPGRWNNPGRPLVYVSSHLSLSALELLVHLQREDEMKPIAHWEINVPEGAIGATPALPPDWRTNLRATRAIGDDWLASGSSPVIAVPSAIIPSENNYLINPAHKKFDISWAGAGPTPFFYDPRLITRLPTP